MFKAEKEKAERDRIEKESQASNGRWHPDIGTQKYLGFRFRY